MNLNKLHKIIEVVHEDEHLILVNKPADLLTLPDRYNKDEPNLIQFLKATRDEVFTVHRLDRQTSGIILFAKSRVVHKQLSKQFNERSLSKTYLALVDGVPHQKEGKIDLALSENPQHRGRMMVNTRSGKKSLSIYRIVEPFNHYALLEVDIHTGRMHQIRVHLKALGHPLAVDEIYGRRTGFLLSELKHKYKMKRFEEEKPLMSRTSLHAFRLIFEHPINKEEVKFEAPLHKDFRAVLSQLRKLNK